MLGDIRRIRKEKERKQRKHLVRRVERGFSKLETCFEEMRVFSTQFDCSMKVLGGLAEDLDGSCDESFLMEVLESKTTQVIYDKRLFCEKCRSGEHFEELLTEVTEVYSENGASESVPRNHGTTECGGCSHTVIVNERDKKNVSFGRRNHMRSNHKNHSFSNNEHEDIVVGNSELAKHKNDLYNESRNETQSMNESELREEQRDKISMNLGQGANETETDSPAEKPTPNPRKKVELTWGELIDIKDEAPSHQRHPNKTSLRKLSDYESGKNLRDSLAKNNLFRFDSEDNKEVYSGNQSPQTGTLESLTSPNLLSSRVLYSEDLNSKEAHKSNHASIDKSNGFNSLLNKALAGNKHMGSQETNQLKIKVNGNKLGNSAIKRTDASDKSKTEDGEVVDDSEFERRMFGSNKERKANKRLDKRITFGADMIAAHFGSYDSKKNEMKSNSPVLRKNYINNCMNILDHI